ncbi:MAG: prepilin-type N-terminal cleavage/methylation domain-containing protein [Eubacteriales bacterium]|nr:prepilin-type N-terminal cleavage/methylation domain-containing protein [Eubacteriales bacterium]
MKKQIQSNKGFSLIELLIAMTIFSIIMLMVVTFMSTTTAAYRKTQKNVDVQTEAMQVSEQISDILMQAKYLRVTSSDGKVYTLDADSSIKGKDSRKFEELSGTVASNYPSPTDGASLEVYKERIRRLNDAFNLYGSGVATDFVPDNYPNYVAKKVASDPSTTPAVTPVEERKVIIDYEKFQLVDEKGVAYPLSGDAEVGNMFSFRLLKPIDDWGYVYVKPQYIYAEYLGKESGVDKTYHVIYYVSPTGHENEIYMYREEESGTRGYKEAKDEVDALVGGSKGRLTKLLDDFYLTADVTGNSVITNIMYDNSGYQYNTRNTTKLRNSNVLTVQPQKLYQKKLKKLFETSTTPSSAPETLGP